MTKTAVGAPDKFGDLFDTIDQMSVRELLKLNVRLAVTAEGARDEDVARALDDALAAVERVADSGGSEYYADFSVDYDLDRAYQAGWSDAIAACASEVADLT